MDKMINSEWEDKVATYRLGLSIGYKKFVGITQNEKNIIHTSLLFNLLK